MSRVGKVIVTRVCLLVALWLSGCSILPTPVDVSGVWGGFIEYTSGPAGIQSPITLRIVQEDHDLSGTITLVGPGSIPFNLDITTGRVARAEVSLEATGVLAIQPPQNVTLRLEGELADGRISGEGTQIVNEVTFDLLWEADLIEPPTPEE